MREGLKPGATGTAEVDVTEALTVPALPLPGVAGMAPVFATPYLVGLAEMACCQALAAVLEEGEGSVGIDVAFSHTAATPVGRTVRATATVTAVDRRQVTFEVVLNDDVQEIGRGTHRRAVIDQAKFLARLAG